MRPSNSRPQQQPHRSFNTASADLMVGEIASEMLAFIAAQYENASEDERLELILRYAPVMRDLQTAIARASRARRRNYTQIEHK
jgi:hypothetical protein